MKSLKDRAVKRGKKGKRYPYNPYADVIKLFGAPVLSLWLRLKVHRITDRVPKRIKGSVIIAANHTSFWDPVVIFCVFWYRRLSFFAARELFEKPINSFFFKNMNCIAVNREQFNTDALRCACHRLSSKKGLVIFPEGAINRSKNGISDYKHGTVYLAIKSRCSVVPVYIDIREKWYQRTHVIVGEPIDVGLEFGHLSRDVAVDEASKYLRQKELELVEFYKSKIKKHCSDVDVAYKIIPNDGDIEPVYPEERAMEIDRVGNDKVKREKYFAWKLLEDTVEKRYGRPFTDFTFEKNENGKWTCGDFFFSISHSGDVVAVAVSEKEVGIDVERVKRHIDGLEERVMSEAELQRFYRADPDKRQEMFIKLWTQKESIFKTLNEKSFLPSTIEAESFNTYTKRLEFDGEAYYLSVCGEDVSDMDWQNECCDQEGQL